MPEWIGRQTDRGVSRAFTRRQEQVIGCLAAGMTDVEIAARLSISPRTVRMHCDIVKNRLAVAHRRQIPLAYRMRSGHDALDLFMNILATDAAPRQ